MHLTEYYDRLDQTTRKVIATAYVRAIWHLKANDHPALSSDNADETSALLARRIVSRFSRGVRNLDELKAYAIAGIDCQVLLRRLKAVRTEFEAKQSRYDQLRACLAAPGRFNRSSLRKVLTDALDELAATQAKYIRLLQMWADEPHRLLSFGAAPQRRIRLVSSQDLCFVWRAT